MPRISIDDEDYEIPGVIALIRKMGEDAAIGHLVRFWRIAQQFYKQGRRPIPSVMFEAHGFSEMLVQFQLAERRDDGVHVIDAEDRFGWLVARVKGGQRSGEVRGSKTPGSNNNEGLNLTKREQTMNSTEHMFEPSPPLPPSPPLSPKDKTKTKTTTGTPADAVVAGGQVSLVLGSDPLEKPEPLPRLALLWNDVADQVFSRVRSMEKSSTRYKACLARWRERSDEKYWRDVIARVNASDFCKGKNRNSWMADIEFVTRPDSAAKILEGKYDNRISHTPPVQQFKTAAEKKADWMADNARKIRELDEQAARERQESEGRDGDQG